MSFKSCRGYYENKDLIEGKIKIDSPEIVQKLDRFKEILLVSPTGTGKTTFIERNLDSLLRSFRRVYFVSFRKVNAYRVSWDNHRFFNCTIAKFITLRLEDVSKSLLIIDEIHELETEKYAFEVISKFKNNLEKFLSDGMKILGLTATPTAECLIPKEDKCILSYKKEEKIPLKIVSFRDNLSNNIHEYIVDEIIKKESANIRVKNLKEALKIISKLPKDKREEIGVICSPHNSSLEMVPPEFIRDAKKKKIFFFTSYFDSGESIPWKPIFFCLMEGFEESTLEQIWGRVRGDKTFEKISFHSVPLFDSVSQRIKERNDFLRLKIEEESEDAVKINQEITTNIKLLKSRAREFTKSREKVFELESYSKKIKKPFLGERIGQFRPVEFSNKKIILGILHGFWKKLSFEDNFEGKKIIFEELLKENFSKLNKKILDLFYDSFKEFKEEENREILISSRYGKAYQKFNLIEEVFRRKKKINLKIIPKVIKSKRNKIEEIIFLDEISEKIFDELDLEKALPLNRSDNPIRFKAWVFQKYLKRIPLLKRSLESIGGADSPSFTFEELKESFEENKKDYLKLFRIVMPYFQYNEDGGERPLRTYMSRILRKIFFFERVRRSRNKKRDTIYTLKGLKEIEIEQPEGEVAFEFLNECEGGIEYTWHNSPFLFNPPPNIGA